MKKVYFILGVHRSGTSALSGVLNMMGLDIGNNPMSATKANPKGYYENNLVFHFNHRVLLENQSSWDDCHFNINKISKISVRKYIDEAKTIICDQFKFSQQFLIKDPTICLLFPIWEKACSELDIEIKIVIPFRNPLEVAESLKQRDGFSYQRAFIVWAQNFLSAEVLTRNFTRLFISFNDLLHDTKKTINKLEEFTGLKATDIIFDNIHKFLRKSFKHNNFAINNFSEDAPESFLSLINILKISKFENKDLFDKIRKEFSYSLEFFQHKEIIDVLNEYGKVEQLIKGKNNNLHQLDENYNLSNELKGILNTHQLNKQSIDDLTLQSKEVQSQHVHEIQTKQQIIDNLTLQLKEVQSQHAHEIQTKHKAEDNLTFNSNESDCLLQKKQKEYSIKLLKINKLCKKEHKAHIQTKLDKKLLKKTVAQQKEKLDLQLVQLNKNKFTNQKATEKIDALNIETKVLSKKLASAQKELREHVEQNELDNTKVINEYNDEKLKTQGNILKVQEKIIDVINQYHTVCSNQYFFLKQETSNTNTNLKLFYNIGNSLTGIRKKQKNLLFRKIEAANKGVSKFLNPFMLANLLDQVSTMEKDVKKIEKKINRVPWKFIELFNEDAYLDINLDIKIAISNGQFSSATEHFILFGYDEVKNKGRLLGLGIPQFTANRTNKTEGENDFHFRKYLEQCYLNNNAEEMTPKINVVDEFRALINLTIEPEVIDSFSQDIIQIPQESEVGELTSVDESYPEIVENQDDEVLNKYTYKEPVLTSEIKQEISAFDIKPLISIIMPVYNVDPKWLDLAINSIKNQWYQNWELCIADDKSDNQKTLDYLNSIDKENIKIHFLKKNENISVASNKALALVGGDYVALMDNDDELTPNALYEVVKAINEYGAEFIYSDEDKLEMNGSFSDPHFKPDFSPDMFLSQNYLSHLGVIKTDLITKVNGFTKGLEGSQDYDLYLKVLEHTDKIHHIPKVLYHWRKVPGSTAAVFSDKSYAQAAGVQALKNAMERRKVQANVLNGKYPGTYRIKYKIHGEPLVSIIIPFKDKPELLKMCLDSIIQHTTYKNFEIIGISNNSKTQEIFDEMKRFEAMDNRIKFYEYNYPFNFSEINNHAVFTYAKGSHIILLNNDIEIITPDWIESMLELSQRQDTAAIGVKLYYPNETIQHAGVGIGVLTLAGHNFKNHPRHSPAYMGRESVIQNLSAVTAACLMVKKQIFVDLDGLDDENLTIAFNDIDFCLRMREAGFLNIFTPYCEAYHHESISRGYEDTPEKVQRFNNEVKYMLDRHNKILANGDPYYNVNLTLEKEDFSLGNYGG